MNQTGYCETLSAFLKEARQATVEFVLSHSRQPFQGTPSIMIFDPSGTLVAFQTGPVPVDSIETFIAQCSN